MHFLEGGRGLLLPVFVWYFIFSWFSFHICTDIIYGVKCGEHVLGFAPTKRIFMVLTKNPDLCKWTFYKKNGGNNCIQWAGGKCEAIIDVEKPIIICWIKSSYISLSIVSSQQLLRVIICYTANWDLDGEQGQAKTNSHPKYCTVDQAYFPNFFLHLHEKTFIKKNYTWKF